MAHSRIPYCGSLETFLPLLSQRNNCPFSFPTTRQTWCKPIPLCLPQDPAQERIPSLFCLEKRQDSLPLPTNIFIHLSQILKKKNTLLSSTWLLPPLFPLNTTYSLFKPRHTGFCPLHSGHFSRFKEVQRIYARHCTGQQGHEGKAPTSSSSVRGSGHQRACNHPI